ncbi:MAG TPA: NAD(P)H-hydrate dehydratase [Pyrinomonadaceae bacterium]|jgi:NAD(P)H-hydrate epimerase|nr:NAD(P)H-hydrate dehydratase [Pyrinomonadaceae bacterium]
MQKVLSAKEMREVDRLTTERYGIPSLILMENAAQAAACIIREKLGGTVDGSSILVMCGRGNNGGDGAALARVLWQQGADVEVCLFGKVQNTEGDARVNFEILQNIAEYEGFELTQADLAFEEIETLEEWLEYDSLNFHADDPDVLVDALFGTGLSRPLEEMYEQAAAYINAFCEGSDECGTLVVSLDVPSGLDADRANQIGTNVHAHLTVSFTAPKLANVLPPASDFNGELHVVNIGSPCELVNNSASQAFVSQETDAAHWLKQTEFFPGSYKNKRGHALVIAGSENYTGAAVLCGNAAIRSGVGLVTMMVPGSSQSAIASRVLPEVMVRGVSETPLHSISEKAFSDIEEFWKNADVVAIGSGLSHVDPSTKKFVNKVIKERRTPVVIDADGLNLLSPFRIKGDDLLPLILTPHEGEFLRLLGAKDKKVLDQRVSAVRDFAIRNDVILVLKGERVLIGAPDGRVVINPTGNSGLGKAGNGDTLTGIIAGFVAQAVQMHVDIFETVVAAVYISGLAGDIAAAKFGKRVLTASDVRDSLADAFELLESPNAEARA